MIIIKVVALILFGISQASAGPYSVEELNRLKQGNVVLREIQHCADCNLEAAEAKIFIKASPDKVWYLLDEQEKLDNIVPKISDIRVLKKEISSQSVQVNLSKLPLMPEFEYTLFLDQTEKFKEIKFKKIDGSFNELYGAWRIEPYDNGTILTYIMYIDFGFYLPFFLREFGLNKMLPETLEAIKAEAEK